MSELARVLGLLGWPLEHTLSPTLHAAGLRALGLDAAYVYVPFPVPPDALEDAVRGMRALGLAGGNVTVPHKEAVLALLDEVEPEALAIGAVNTIVRDGAALVGANTDASGLVRALEEAGVALPGARVVVVGAGGAARAAVYGLARAGASAITLAARRRERAERALHGLAATCSGSALDATGLDAALSAAMRSATLVVQATPATGAAGPAASSFVRALALAELTGSATVVDLVYAPADTPLLREARRLGHETLDGLGMLLHQAALALERWTGAPAPLDAMRAALPERAPRSDGARRTG